jgi:hypothetical protein
MGIIKEIRHVKPICGVLFAKGIDLPKVTRELNEILGPIQDQTPIFDFSFTDYYKQEMGVDLKKCFLSFTNLVHPKLLPGIKIKTNAIEAEWSIKGKRRVNLDPGYVTGAKVVLATTKDFAHRVYLADGIYGDVQLQYKHQCFNTYHWTYPDYQTDLVLTFFERVREQVNQEEKTIA